MTLRQLSKYLCSILINKQEELNNSIVERMNGMECGGIRNDCGDGCVIKSIDKCENPLNETRSPRRVHFVPNIEDIVSLIDENSLLADFTSTEGASEETNHLELKACLEKLNEEAAALYGIYNILLLNIVIIFLIFFLDIINNELKLMYLNSEDICQKTFMDKKLEYYKVVSNFFY